MNINLVSDYEAICYMSIIVESSSDQPSHDDLLRLKGFINEIRYHCNLRNSSKGKSRETNECSKFIVEKIIFYLRLSNQFDSN